MRVPPQPARGTSGSCSRRVRITVGGVAEVLGGAFFTWVKAMRPAPQRRVVVRLFGSEVRLLQVLHVLPGEEVLFDDFLLQRKELGGTAGWLVTGVSRLADRGLGVEVVGVVLVYGCLPGDLDGGHQFAGETDETQPQRVVVVDDLGVDRPVGRQPGRCATAAEMSADRGV